ncbi:Uncharacterised protein [Mycobacteroides abscessus]|nr:Uncharacterised protein [Mycobacteroides abscessus]
MSQTTRAAIVSVLPEPAPATTSVGSSGASITSTCSGVGRGRPRRSAIRVAESVGFGGSAARCPSPGVSALSTGRPSAATRRTVGPLAPASGSSNSSLLTPRPSCPRAAPGTPGARGTFRTARSGGP